MSTISIPSAFFTRPADITAYASGDLVANSTTAISVVPMTFVIRPENLGSVIRRVRIRKTSANITASSFRLHLYSTGTITEANGDNGAWVTTAVANYVGSVDVTVDKAFTDGAQGVGAPSAGADITYPFGTIYGLLEARGAYTPTSGEIYTVELEEVCDPNDKPNYGD
jgi:hypothetical protein